MNKIEANNQVVVFNDHNIRRTFLDGTWWFSIVDVIKTLTNSSNPRDYWYKMKVRVQSEAGVELSTFCRQLKLESSDGKNYSTDCANTESLFRIIQSIPSPKAEPKLLVKKMPKDLMTITQQHNRVERLREMRERI